MRPLPEQGGGCQTSEHSPDFYGRHHQGNYNEKKYIFLVKRAKILARRKKYFDILFICFKCANKSVPTSYE